MVQVVLVKIAVSLCVIAMGWLGARKLRAGNEAPHLPALISILSRLVLDVSLPALAFTAIVKTAAPESPGQALLIPIVGFGIFTLAALCGAALAVLVASPPRRRTLIFVIAVPNWIYLPLPIAAGLYGAIGTRTVLLLNVGALLWLWTAGVFILSGQASLRSALRAITSRPGLWGTLAGIAVGIFAPGLQPFLAEPSAAHGLFAVVPLIFFQSLEFLGTLTTPLALLCTGAQLAQLGQVGSESANASGNASTNASGRSSGRELAAALLGRLLLGPLLTFAVLHLLPPLMPAPVQATVALAAAMPVAVSCSMFTREFGGDDKLAATSILVSTVISLVTVPALLALWPQ